MTQVMHCHDPVCEEFNQPHEFGYKPATWESPSEWGGEPECPNCLGEVFDTKFDTRQDINNFVSALGEHGINISFPHGGANDALYRLMHQFVKEEWA